jgi:hypothetical protein
VASTHEHACFTLLTTCPQSTRRDDEPGEPSNHGPGTPGSMTPNNPGAGTGTMQQQVPAQTPGHLVWLGFCPVCLDIVDARQRIKGDRLCPSGCALQMLWVSTSSSASHVDSPSTGAFWCTTIGREELRRSLVGSLTLVSNDDARVRCGGMTPAFHKSPFESRDENRRQHHTRVGRTMAGGLQNGLSWVWASFPQDKMRKTPLSQPWQPRQLTSMTGPAKSQVGQSVLSTQAQHSTAFS